MPVPVKRRTLFAAVSVVVLAVGGAAACTDILGIGNRSLDPGTGVDAAADGTFADSPADGGAGDGKPGGETGPCGDTMADAHNCGRCGHDCLGGACSAGVCQPVAIVPGSAGYRPWQLALTATAVYFTDTVNGQIATVNKDGTGLRTLDSSGFRDNALGLDDAGVFFSDLNANAIVHCTLTSCGAAPTVLATVPSGGDVVALALDQGITFADDYCNLYRLPTKLGGTPTALILSDGGSPCSPYTDDVRSDGTHLYLAQDDGHVWRMEMDGGGVVNLSGSLTVPLANGLAIDSQAIYWTQQDPNLALPGTVNVTGLDGTNPHVLASNQANPMHIVSDGTNVYWTTLGFGSSGNSGKVWMCSPGSCQPVTLATQQPDPQYIVVDDQAVYWTDYDGVNNFPATVMKVAKP
jgi:hypothetical protein